MIKTTIALAVSSVLLLAGCNSQHAAPQNSQDRQQIAASNTLDNPLLRKSSLQYQAPEFNLIHDGDIKPAFKQGITENLAEIEQIIAQKDVTFANTIVALEKSGETLSRVSSYFWNISLTDSNPERRALQQELAPLSTQHNDNIYLNKALFKRVEQIHNNRDNLNLDAGSKRLVEVYYKRFIRAGAKLTAAQQTKIRALNKEHSQLTTQFGQNLLQETSNIAVTVDNKRELKGLTDTQIDSMAAAAKQAGKNGKYLISITNTTRQPILAHIENRSLRERIWRASAERAQSGETNNMPIIKRLAEIRAQRANLLGFDSWAAYGLSAQMAQTPETVFSMFSGMTDALMTNVELETQAIKAKMAEKGDEFELQPWDWAFYAELVRQDKYALDENTVKSYFEFNRVLEDGLFFTMKELYGVEFKHRPDLPVYHPDVKAYELFDHDGTSLAIFYADYFARPGKRGGAWMSSFVDQTHLLAQKPVVVNVMNIAKAPEGQPTLLSYGEVTTMFHELGHGIHGMFSDVKYPSLAGTSVSTDFVEFPSTFEEDWAIHPKVISNYAKHYKTNAAIPTGLLDKIVRSRSFNQGFDTLEYVAAAIVDMEWHSLSPTDKVENAEQFEQDTLKKHGLYVPYIQPRYKSAFFSHSMGGGYSASYYAYMWSEILAADAYAYVQSQGGLDRKIGDHYRKNILEVGNSRPLMDSYKAFRGQAPTTDALLTRRGLQTTNL
ncbi:dipeptidyl carboxypeptidase [Pseudoalteromonas luteoviolacea]|uniref:Dipeptidyl carboxypeptidase n=1 Tax=Pseudoalteromonas luteoviolacea TaxID=43657 RepID=A0A1C0TQP9_9GAMM|nr:M3 family metallopeptidase [Pseudoalteromonas luteoviolacea]OCQ21282.1 dipeptidyl carboxypeptidase [Pseudoalteromonas luteoviolacea]